MNKKLIISLIMIGVMAFGAGLGTFAWFTSSATSTGNTFTTGTLELAVDGSRSDSYSLNFGDTSGMAPGDPEKKVTVVVKNDGTLDMGMFRKFTLTGSDALAKELVITTYKVTDWSTAAVKPGYQEDGTCDLVALWTAKKGDWDFDKDGRITMYDLVNRPYDDGGHWGAVLGLKSEETQTVEIGFTLRKEAGNDVQGQSAVLGMNVVATQINAEAIQDSVNDLTTPYNTIATRLANHVNR